MNFIYFENLPNDIIDNYIFKYLKDLTKVWLNKTFYIKYHYLIKNHIKYYNNYIRDIIRLDYNFIFKKVLDDELLKWISLNKSIKYDNLIFCNYINFINYLINKNNSGKIKNTMILKLQSINYKKNWQKEYKITKKNWIGI